jgi:hypothetical protein
MIPFLNLYKDKNTKRNTADFACQTEVDIDITQRIDESIDEDACKERFQEFTEKRNERIYKKIMFNIRNYVVLSQKEISEIRLLDDTQRMNIIILMNTAIKHLLKLI